MARKRTGKYFPKDFKGYNIIAKFEKEKSRSGRALVTNDPDKWFIDVLYYDKKSGEISETEYIVAKDLDTWKKWFANIGWNIVE